MNLLQRRKTDRYRVDTGTIGPVTSMSSFKESFGTLSATQHGLIVSCILLSGAVSGIFAGNIADVYGRATSFIVGGSMYCFGTLLEASAQSLAMFTAGRVLAGFGEGLFLGNLTVYICEIAPARRRGPLASMVQFLVVFGLMTGYFVCYGTSKMTGSMSWRIPLMLHSIVSLGFVISCFYIPPSPRWLLAKGRDAEAREILEKLGLASSELEEMVEEPSTADLEREVGMMQSIKATMYDFTKVFRKGARSRAALACFLMGFQQFSGIDGVLYYAPLLFSQAGLTAGEASFLASGVSAIVMFVVTIPATIYSDHWGRRKSAITGGIALSSTMLIIGSLYAADAVHGNEGIGRWIVIVAIYVFTIAFSITWAITFKVYASEIQPISTRASASSLAQSANWVSDACSSLS
jgi:sugar porter (SP) family MFS transporter